MFKFVAKWLCRSAILLVVLYPITSALVTLLLGGFACLYKDSVSFSDTFFSLMCFGFVFVTAVLVVKLVVLCIKGRAEYNSRRYQYSFYDNRYVCVEWLVLGVVLLMGFLPIISSLLIALSEGVIYLTEDPRSFRGMFLGLASVIIILSIIMALTTLGVVSVFGIVSLFAIIQDFFNEDSSDNDDVYNNDSDLMSESDLGHESDLSNDGYLYRDSYFSSDSYSSSESDFSNGSDYSGGYGTNHGYDNCGVSSYGVGGSVGSGRDGVSSDGSSGE